MSDNTNMTTVQVSPPPPPPYEECVDVPLPAYEDVVGGGVDAPKERPSWTPADRLRYFVGLFMIVAATLGSGMLLSLYFKLNDSAK
jgi:hypothetical protein